jgi:hypothetical protein
MLPLIGCGPFLETADDSQTLSDCVADTVLCDFPRFIDARFSKRNVSGVNVRYFLVIVGIDKFLSIVSPIRDCGQNSGVFRAHSISVSSLFDHT